MDNRRAGQIQIETAIGLMVSARGMKFDAPINWRKHSAADVYTIDALISGHPCVWNLIGDVVESYLTDLDVRHSVDFNLQTYFVPR
jgi:hypothetical protein